MTDFGPVLSVFFRDPDGLECEVCVTNPDAEPGVVNPPGTCNAVGGWRALNVRNCRPANCSRVR